MGKKLSWVWGQKQPDPVKLKLAVENREIVLIKSKLTVSIDLEVTSPVDVDVFKVISDSRINFIMPPNSSVGEALLTHVQVVGRGG
tara:strand:+ start:798 stop:1055 length:258 start_codon:yes stop_codon:yes gene_type:complete